MIVRRDRHAARVGAFQVCRDEHLDVAHDLARGTYVASAFASAFIGGPLMPLYLMTMFVSGTVYGSTSNSVAEKMDAQTSGSEREESAGGQEPTGFTIAAEVFERMLPVLMLGL